MNNVAVSTIDVAVAMNNVAVSVTVVAAVAKRH